MKLRSAIQLPDPPYQLNEVREWCKRLLQAIDERDREISAWVTAEQFIEGAFEGDVIGDVTGDVTGNLFGNVTGDVTGDVIGGLTGTVLGDVTGDLLGDVIGNVTGDVTGKVSATRQAYGGPTPYTIASGAITIGPISFASVDTEGAAASDYLDTINGGTSGQILILRSQDSARDIILRPNIGNLKIASEMFLNTTADRIILFCDGTYWLPLKPGDVPIITPEMFGAMADGSTDDSTAILNATAAAVAAGTEVVFNGTKTYGLGGAVSISSNFRWRTNGAILKDTAGTTSNTYLLNLQGIRVFVDELNVEIPTGIRRDRAIRFTTCVDIQCGNIKLTSTDVQTTAETADAGVTIQSCTGGKFGRVITSNYDRAVIIHSNSNVRIDGLEITGYVRGAYLYDNSVLFIGASLIKTRSANGSYTAGHNGVLLQCNTDDAHRDVTLQDFTVRDAGEHGIRIGGDKRHSNIFLVRPKVKNCGGCGIKVLGTDTGTPTDRNANIVIDHPIIEDCGTNGDGVNLTGIYVLFADYVQITAPIIRAVTETYSAAYGIVIDACQELQISNPYVKAARNHGIYLYAFYGNVERVTMTGGLAHANGYDGLKIEVVAAKNLRRICVTGFDSDANSNFGFNIVNNGTIIDTKVGLKCYNNTNGIGACNSTAVRLIGAGEVGGTALAGITAGDGSQWAAGTTLHIRKAGTWTAF
jgi:hypothetical protein